MRNLFESWEGGGRVKRRLQGAVPTQRFRWPDGGFLKSSSRKIEANRKGKGLSPQRENLLLRRESLPPSRKSVKPQLYIRRLFQYKGEVAQPSAFQRYILPGFVFQSVVIAGGYGTGRELVEFFLESGPQGGLLAMLVSTVIWSLVCASTFEFARVHRSFEYRDFFKKLLHRGWFLFELCYLVLLLIVLAVAASAAGTILEELFDLYYFVGVLGMLSAAGFLVFKGSAVIERFLSLWSFLLYAVYAVFFIACVFSFGDRIDAAFARSEIGGEWLLGGVAYASYNLGVIPAALFVTRHFQGRRDAIVSGLLAGPIAIFPGFLFFLAVAGFYPEVVNEAVPANYLLAILGSRKFQLLFQLVLFGTLIETGTGFIHAVNERVSGAFRERSQSMPKYVRLIISTTLLALGAALAQFGLVGLISRGYRTVTWGFLIVYVAPILTVGWMKIRKAAPARGFAHVRTGTR